MTKLHIQINNSRRYHALAELKWLRFCNKLARKNNIPRYSRLEVRSIMVNHFGW